MKNLFFVLTLGFIFILSSCIQDKAKENVSLSPQQLEALERMGFNSGTAEIMADGNILVEGDIIVSSESLREVIDAPVENTNGEITERQRAVSSSAALPAASVSLITYRIQNTFTTAEADAIRLGAASWSAYGNGIVLSEVPYSYTAANLTINLNNSMIPYGLAPIPTGGNMSATIQLNMTAVYADCGSFEPEVCITNLATHEIGHTLGFRHTNGTDGTTLVGSGTDANSIMNDGSIGLPALCGLPGPSTDDFRSASALYPGFFFALSIGAVTVTNSSGSNCSISIPYTQPTYAVLYRATVEILQSGTVLQSIPVSTALGIQSTGTTNTGQISLAPGIYQLRVRGRNYRGDFTQTATSNTVNFTKIP